MWYSVQHTLPIRAMWINFLPSWWHGNYHFEFGEKYVFDPIYRVNMVREAERLVAARFPDLGLGSAEPVRRVIGPDFGNAVTPAAAGCEVVYPIDNHPWNKHLDEEAIANLRVPGSLLEQFPYSEIVQQTRELNRRLGQDTAPFFQLRGVLNDAALIQGSDFLARLAGQPSATRHLLDYTYGMARQVALHDMIDFRTRDTLWIANCCSIMVGPTGYEKSLLQYDLHLALMIRAAGHLFGLHHCGKMDDYLESYRQLPAIHWVEIGWGSSLRATLETFPKAQVQAVISSSFLSSATADEVADCVRGLLEEAEGNLPRVSISAPDLEYGTPDDNIAALIEACRAQPACSGGDKL